MKIRTPRLASLALTLLACPAPAAAQDAVGPTPPEPPAERPAADLEAQRAAEVETYLRVGLSLDCADSLDAHLAQRRANLDALHRRLGQIIREGAPREWIIAEVAGLRSIDDRFAPWKTGQCPGDPTVALPPCATAASRVNAERLADRRLRKRALGLLIALDPEGAAREIEAWRRDEQLDPMVRALLR
jgi:hypothetical protein